MCDTYDYRLFNNITRNPHHFLHQLLLSVFAAAENYNLRSRKHNRMLPQRTTRLFDSNFIYRLFILTFINFLRGYVFNIVVLRCGLSTFYLINELLCVCTLVVPFVRSL